MDFGAKIKSLRMELGLTLEEVGKIVGVGKSTVRKWESGQIANMRRDKIALLAHALQISPTELMGWEKEEPPLPAGAIPYSSMQRIPIIGSVRAGAGGLALEEVSGYELADVRNPEEYFFLRVVGDSMSPEINEGDLALVHRQPDIESGELAVAIINEEEGTIKKIIKRADSIVLQSFNPSPEYMPRIFIGEEMNEVRIAGKVVRTVRIW